MPGISYAAAGALSGFVVQIYANSLRRIPALRRMPPRPTPPASPRLLFLFPLRLAPLSPRPAELAEGGAATAAEGCDEGSTERPAYWPPKRRAVSCPACAGADRFKYTLRPPYSPPACDPPARRCRAVDRTGIHVREWKLPAKGMRATRRVRMGGNSLAMGGPLCECPPEHPSRAGAENGAESRWPTYLLRSPIGPWEHMILMGIGAYGMDYLGKYTIKAQEVLFAAA